MRIGTWTKGFSELLYLASIFVLVGFVWANLISPPAAQVAGETVNVGHPARPKGSTLTIMAYAFPKTLATDRVTAGKLPGDYARALYDAAEHNSRSSGVSFWEGQCLIFRLLRVRGVQPVEAVQLHGQNQFVQRMMFAEGAMFEVCDRKVAFVLPRSAYNSRYELCFELVTPGFRLADVPALVKGPYTERGNVLCSILGRGQRAIADRTADYLPPFPFVIQRLAR